MKIKHFVHLKRVRLDTCGSTPLHWACYLAGNGESEHALTECLEIVKFLVCKEKITLDEGSCGPTYNMLDDFGCTPVFLTRESRVVEYLLNYNDLSVTDGDGNPLLYECIRKNILTETIANDDRMKSQLGLRHRGLLPIALLVKGGENWIKYHVIKIKIVYFAFCHILSIITNYLNFRTEHELV